MEFLDIVDENDLVIGSSPKGEIYEKSLWHRICHVLIFNSNNEVALQLRSKTVSYRPNYRSTAVGGHVQSGETYEEGALREYEEELGVQTKLEFVGKDLYQAKGAPNKFLGIFKTIFDGPFHPDKEAVEKIEFFTIEEIKNMIRNGEKFHPELIFILEKYIF